MGYRIFRDSHGIEWQTWDVIPRLAERRASERRRAAVVAAMVAVERRRAHDRRVLAGRRPVLSAGLDDGWLCFEATTAEKRRLTPIPVDWLRCDDACLEGYCREARPAGRSSVAVDISTLADLQN
jgi:hypothetical protein